MAEDLFSMYLFSSWPSIFLVMKELYDLCNSNTSQVGFCVLIYDKYGSGFI